MKFLDEDFMLKGKTARKLYHEYAENLPIIDYHCHLNPAEIANDRRFDTITEAWLGGDHYKWRLMRINGVDESLITGNGGYYEKFEAYAQTLETAIGNPLYHWTHLEMKRFFGIDRPLTKANAREMYDRMNAVLKEPEFSARGFIKRSNVQAICTTDDPADTLEFHKAIAAKPVEGCTVRPTFRPDRAILIERPDFCDYMKALEKASGIAISKLDDLLAALYNRVDYFHENGCRLSDHDFGMLPLERGSEAEVKEIFDRRMSGKELSLSEQEKYKTYMISQLADCFAQKGWTMQLHCGAMRNNNSRMFALIGRDTGFDTMSDYELAFRLSRLLDGIEQSGRLPKTVIYSLNPKDNYAIAALCGCFTAPGVRGKTQFGSAWWFVDHADGMERQMRDTASLNLLSCFVGMLTDSRSFLSYPRHEYFRRIFCNLVGRYVDEGEYPCDWALLRRIVEGVCYENAKEYFAL